MPLPETDTIDDDPTHLPKCQCHDCQRDREDMYGDWLREEQIDWEIERRMGEYHG